MSDDAALFATTRRVIDRFTEEGLLFTSLDVSNVVKQSLPVRHREVAPVIRELFGDGAFGEDYTRSLIDVLAKGRDKTQAYLYHLDFDDPSLYSDAQRSQLAIPPVSASPTDDMVVDATISEQPLALGKDGRLRIPKKFLERAGVTTKEVNVHYLAGGPDLVLSSLNPGQQPGVAVLTYSHPSLLHVPRKLVEGFDPQKTIAARIDSKDPVVQVVGTKR